MRGENLTEIPVTRSNSMALFNRTSKLNNTLAYGAIPPVNTEQMIMSDSGNYIDPLVRDHVDQCAYAEHRERRSNEDPLGVIITMGFAIKGWSDMPKFFVGDIEVLQDVRQFLMDIGWKLPAIIHTKNLMTHGWSVMRWMINEQMKLEYRIFSENVIRPEDIERSMPGNEPTIYHLRGRRPLLPCNRTVARIIPEHDDMRVDDPSVFRCIRGPGAPTYWYGLSRMEKGWDSLVKLTKESHAWALKQRVFPISVVPPYWSDAQVEQYFKKVSHMDESTAMVSKAAKDDSGTLYPDIPSMAWITPAASKSGGASGAGEGSGGVRGLSPEFVRYCAVYDITVKELSGDPGGAQEAGATDFAQGLLKNIIEWNYTCEPLMRDFLERLVEIRIIPPLPSGLKIMGCWEWQMLEMQQQAAIQQSQMQQGSSSKSKQQGDPGNKDQAKKDQPEEKNNFNPALYPYQFHDYIQRTNSPPMGVMAPITSSWVSSYGWDESAFYMTFHGSDSVFRYPHVGNPQGMATGIESSGSPGGFVHDASELGVPARTPYEQLGSLPQTMAYSGGSQQATMATSQAGHQAKMADFGAKRPAREPNMKLYPGQTEATTESTTGPLRTQPFDMAGIQSALGVAHAPAAMPDWVHGSASEAGQAYTKPQDMKPAQAAPASASGPNLTPALSFQQPMVSAQPNTTADVTAGTLAGAKGRPSTPHTTGLGQPSTVKTHGGKSRRGKPAQGMQPNQTGSSTTSTMPFSYNSLSEELAHLSFEGFNEFLRQNSIATVGKDSFMKMRSVLAHVSREEDDDYAERSNYAAIGNSMSFADHPYLYSDGPGKVSVEYPCKEDWKEQVVGKSCELKINYNNPGNHGSIVIGKINYGWDESNDAPLDVLEYDRDDVMRKLEEHGQMDSKVYKKLLAGLDPDVSTEYTCRVVTQNNHRLQKDFTIHGACIVNEGNCPGDICKFKPVHHDTTGN